MILKEIILFLFMSKYVKCHSYGSQLDSLQLHLFIMLRRFSTSLTMYHVGTTLCQAVQVLLSMKIHRLANTPIQYRYNLTISVIRVSII